MIAYWAFSLASLLAAFLDAGKRSRPLWIDRWLLLVGLAIFVLPSVKVASRLLAVATESEVNVPLSKESTQPAAPSKGCRPELVSSDSGPVSNSKNGRSGRVAWYFWVGNLYTWQLNVLISAGANGASGTASAVGTMSSWNSVIVHPMSATASAKGSIDCRPAAGDCVCFTGSTSDIQSDRDFMASVEVQSTETRAGAQLKVVSSAGVSGTAGLSGVKAGLNGGAGAIGVELQRPNTARDVMTKAKSYSYRCVNL